MERNQIICGEASQILAQFPSNAIDLVVTDPPYLINYKDRNGRTLENDDNPQAVLNVYPEIARVMKPDSYCVSFYGWSSIDLFSNAWKRSGLRVIGHLVWPKRYASNTGLFRYSHEAAYVLAKGYPPRPNIRLSDTQEWIYSGNHFHPTEKSVRILDPLINAFSNSGDIVLDPFSGSGSTVIAAANNGRSYIGIELNPTYCNIAKRRLMEEKDDPFSKAA